MPRKCIRTSKCTARLRRITAACVAGGARILPGPTGPSARRKPSAEQESENLSGPNFISMFTNSPGRGPEGQDNLQVCSGTHPPLVKRTLRATKRGRTAGAICRGNGADPKRSGQWLAGWPGTLMHQIVQRAHGRTSLKLSLFTRKLRGLSGYAFAA